MPLGWPPYYPNDLIPQTTVIIGEARKKFRVQTQTLQLCRYVISKLTPHLCALVQSKKLRADLALSSMSDLLDYLLVANCENEREEFRLKQGMRKSGEWLELAGQLARASSAATKRAAKTHSPIVAARNTAIVNLKRSHAGLKGINLHRVICQKLTGMGVPPPPHWNVRDFNTAYHNDKLKPLVRSMISKAKVE